MEAGEPVPITALDGDEELFEEKLFSPALRVFSGQLYESDPATKGWTLLFEGLVSVSFAPGSQGKWIMVARLEKSKAKVRMLFVTVYV